MELRQLRYFIKTAEFLSFSEAAKALFITQSTLSQQIKQLENELDTQLFQRDSHTVTLTETGKELLPYAYKTLSSAISCVEHIRDVKNLVTGTLNIGVTYTFSPILTETVLQFMKLHPNVRLNIIYKPMEELMEMLEKQEVDFVLSFKPTRSYDNIESHILFDNHISAIVNKFHPLAKKESVDLDTLQQYDIALPGRGLQARNAFDELTYNRNYRFRVRVTLNEVNILLKMIEESTMVSILSDATIYGLTHSLVAVPITGVKTEMEGCIHLRKDCYQKVSAQEFVKLLCNSDAVRQRAYKWINNL